MLYGHTPSTTTELKLYFFYTVYFPQSYYRPSEQTLKFKNSLCNTGK